MPGQEGKRCVGEPGRGAAAPSWERWDDGCSMDECWGGGGFWYAKINVGYMLVEICKL